MRKSRPKRAYISSIFFMVFVLALTACDSGQPTTPAATSTTGAASGVDPTAMTSE